MRPETTRPLTQLKQVATHLRSTGEPELAEFVEYATTTAGNKALMRAIMQQREIDGEIQPTFMVTIPERVRTQIKTKAEKAGEDLTEQANEALTAFIDGEYLPTQPMRAAYGSNVKKKNLNLRPSRDLRAQADARGKELEAELGWAPRASHVITSWLWERYSTVPRQ
ncbi:hypothetical protein [Streptomyces decoyicus]|uniref:hypothetical protein n=1 Tax=Streptomyces decoyicus TaxID=249567 RepID=UPI002F917E9E